MTELPSVLEEPYEIRTLLGHCRYESVRKLTEILTSKECAELDKRAAAMCIINLGRRLDTYRRAQ